MVVDIPINCCIRLLHLVPLLLCLTLRDGKHKVHYYYKAGTSGNALNCHIISAGLWLNYLQTSMFISIFQTADGIISPVEFAKEASHF